MAKKKTHEQFVKEIYDLVCDEYSILENYKGSKTKIRFKHNKCGYEFNMLPSNFIHLNQRCPKCAGSMKKNTNQFIEETYHLFRDEYTVLGQYISTDIKILIRHNKCGHEWLITPHSFLKGHGCPKCAKRKLSSIFSKTQNQFEQEVKKLVGDKYTVMSKYKNSKTKITMKHNKCGYIWDTTPQSFLLAHSCPICSEKRRALGRKKTNKQFIKEVKELVGDEYTVLSEYSNDNKTKIKFKHNKCGHEFDMSPNGFLRGNRCPKCNESHGETVIRKYLRKNHIKFRSQYRIKECKNVRMLPFDFALFNKNKLIALIEYDGRQHKIPIKHFGGMEGLKRTMKNDLIKTNYCLANEVPLIRIPYTEKDIENYLDNELSKLNKPIQLALI